MFETFMKWLLPRAVEALKLPKRVISREDGKPYLVRWYLCGEDGGLKYFGEGQTTPRWWQKALTWLPCVYIHCFKSSDTDPEFHNHPWCATSLILAGGYDEERRVDSISARGGYKIVLQRFKPGMTNHLFADTFHRVHLIGDDECWTAIALGEKVQSWGFYSFETGKFLHWRDHQAEKVRIRQKAMS
jgi:hypothetical protein